jgi:hypothetical protein
LIFHNLEIEKGRHKNLPEHIRICTLCNCEVEDEIHFLMRCTKLKTVLADSYVYLFQFLNYEH